MKALRAFSLIPMRPIFITQENKQTNNTSHLRRTDHQIRGQIKIKRRVNQVVKGKNRKMFQSWRN